MLDLRAGLGWVKSKNIGCTYARAIQGLDALSDVRVRHENTCTSSVATWKAVASWGSTTQTSDFVTQTDERAAQYPHPRSTMHTDTEHVTVGMQRAARGLSGRAQRRRQSQDRSTAAPFDKPAARKKSKAARQARKAQR